MPTSDDPRITVRLSKATPEALTAWAKKNGQTLSAYVRQQLENQVPGKTVIPASAAKERMESPTDPIPASDLTREDKEHRWPEDKPPFPMYRCPRHPKQVAPSPNARCFCNRKTSEPCPT